MKLALVASPHPAAQAAFQEIYPTGHFVSVDDADVIVALGGDGFMLRALHQYKHLNKPIYGLNRGSVGFLMNQWRDNNLEERVQKADLIPLFPLAMTAKTLDGQTHQAQAINEIALFRKTYQAARIEVIVDGEVRVDNLVCDGVLLATPAGSTAYNLSAHGPVIPIGAPLLALTPISPFRPRRWHGALLPDSVEVTFRVLDSDSRQVCVTADFEEFHGAQEVSVHLDRRHPFDLLFDPDHNLEERIISEQFVD